MIQPLCIYLQTMNLNNDTTKINFTNVIHKTTPLPSLHLKLQVHTQQVKKRFLLPENISIKIKYQITVISVSTAKFKSKEKILNQTGDSTMEPWELSKISYSKKIRIQTMEIFLYMSLYTSLDTKDHPCSQNILPMFQSHQYQFLAKDNAAL